MSFLQREIYQPWHKCDGTNNWWRVQKSTGKTLDEPEDGNDHCMDALAYAVRDMERKQVEYGAVRF